MDTFASLGLDILKRSVLQVLYDTKIRSLSHSLNALVFGVGLVMSHKEV